MVAPAHSSETQATADSSAASVLLQYLEGEVAAGYPLEQVKPMVMLSDDERSAPSKQTKHIGLGVDEEHTPYSNALSLPLPAPPALNDISDNASYTRTSAWSADLSLRTESSEHSSAKSSGSREAVFLARQSTILVAGSSPRRTAKDLKVLLGRTNAKLKSGATIPLKADSILHEADVLHLEGGVSKARVHLDLLLESNTCFQGGYLNGTLLVIVQKKPGQIVMVADGRLRLIGFECIAPVKERSIFYEYVVPLSSVARDLDDLYLSGADEEGFMLANEGQFLFPFSFEISSTADYGAPKGSFTPHSGVALRYIVMASIRIKDPISEKKSVAHFYRDIHVWPRLETSEALSPLSRPIQVTMSDFDGALKFTVILHRLTWIAGQPCFLKFFVVNKTVKTVRSLAIELHRDTVVYKPQPGSNGTDDDINFEAFTVSKLISAVSLPMGDRAERGYAGARGWWTGVLPGESLQFSHSIALPVDALSVSKGRLLEVAYRLRAAISLGNLLPAELSADVPIRIINFISLDPPPSQPNVPPAMSTQASSQTGHERSGKRPISSLSKAGLKHALAMHQEDRDIVREVVVTAPVPNMQSENSAGHFADLYYNSLQEHSEGYLGSDSSDDIAGRPTSNDHPPEMRTLPTKVVVTRKCHFSETPTSAANMKVGQFLTLNSRYLLLSGWNSASL
ncbi:hypothetical protein DFP72DRAFT_27643 [Ephemerocybe angulata]|uniref:Arrestin C-terminal-like domain-containing protein n=1 Tax=Ephemerocybe angulata TaxID=980116 RepID=A0A8H6ILK5_9AGAR|nr:hypothetical protein DFP72DRAFT_27643 [Tulosesus angulatus]